MKIYVAAIHHGYGVDFYAYRSEAGMKSQIAGYAKKWWERENTPECPDSKTDEEIIQTYFEQEIEYLN